jgi:hypothetical protein
LEYIKQTVPDIETTSYFDEALGEVKSFKEQCKSHDCTMTMPWSMAFLEIMEKISPDCPAELDLSKSLSKARNNLPLNCGSPNDMMEYQTVTATLGTVLTLFVLTWGTLGLSQFVPQFRSAGCRRLISRGAALYLCCFVLYFIGTLSPWVNGLV